MFKYRSIIYASIKLLLMGAPCKIIIPQWVNCCFHLIRSTINCYDVCLETPFKLAHKKKWMMINASRLPPTQYASTHSPFSPAHQTRALSCVLTWKSTWLKSTHSSVRAVESLKSLTSIMHYNFYFFLHFAIGLWGIGTNTSALTSIKKKNGTFSRKR